jgi:hypothetical protein
VRSLLFVFLVVLVACSRQEAPRPAAQRPVSAVTPGRADIGGATVNLPRQVGEWTRPDTARRITAETIFDYMDGAGELYLAYRFDHLDVFEYKPADTRSGTILVEVYTMKAPDDAFGLLSNDWGGEQPAFDQGASIQSAVFPRARALYGAGLLRIWSRALYIRILASRESSASREAVMTIGRALTGEEAGRTSSPSTVPASPAASWPPPILLDGFKAGASGSRSIRPDRTCFFRSHLVLNSQYFLASEDILGLGLDVEAGTTEYQAAVPGSRPLRAILARYPTDGRAAIGLAGGWVGRRSPAIWS